MENVYFEKKIKFFKFLISHLARYRRHSRILENNKRFLTKPKREKMFTTFLLFIVVERLVNPKFTKNSIPEFLQHKSIPEFSDFEK